jgi:aminocarboxymuconate-semialdehyde decarboxylase
MSAPPLRIDLHTHILPEGWEDLDRRYGYAGFVRFERSSADRARLLRKGTCFREIGANCWDPLLRLEECDRHGVDVQVLSTVPVMFSYWARPDDALDLARRLNDHIAGVVERFPRRFVGLGTVPLQDPDLALGELERCVGELGLAGIEIGSHVNGWNLDRPELFPVFERAQSLSAAVFVHPWDMLAPERMEKYWLRWLVGMPAETAIAIASLIFGGVFARLPGLRVAFAHGGGAYGAIHGRLAQGFRVRPDLFADEQGLDPAVHAGRFWVDSLVHDAGVLRLLLELLGPARVALGSDYPFPLGEDEPGRLICSLEELSEADRARLLGANALEFLGLDGERFEPGAARTRAARP